MLRESLNEFHWPLTALLKLAIRQDDKPRHKNYMKVTAAGCCVWHVCFNVGLNVRVWFVKWLISPPHLLKSRWRRWEYGSILGARECAHAVNMRGSKHSCGMLLIGELASWGSKHMRQLRSDSCCITGGADEQGPSCAPPLFITADKRLEVYPRRRRMCECLRDAIIGRSCRTTKSLGGAFWNCCFPFFLSDILNIKRNPSYHGSGVKLQWTVTYVLLILLDKCWPTGTHLDIHHIRTS